MKCMNEIRFVFYFSSLISNYEKSVTMMAITGVHWKILYYYVKSKSNDKSLTYKYI